MNKKIPWFLPETGELEKDNVLKVLESNYLNDGPVARQLEKKISEFLNIKYCITVTSGTAGITLSLIGLGIGYGDEVIVPDLTFIATANAVRLTGADVKLIDIRKDNFTIDTTLIEKNITHKTKAIIPVDVNGRGPDYDELEKIAKKYNLYIICDSAEAFGSKYKGKYLGTYGNAGCFSFSANKTITSGQGGAVVTNDNDLYNRLLELKDQGRRQTGTGGNDLHPVLGFNFKYTNLQASVALSQFERLNDRLNLFKKRESWYRKYLNDCNTIVFPEYNENSGEILQWCDVLVNDKNKIYNILSENNIGYRDFWYPIHTQKPYFIEEKNRFKNTNEISEKGLWLPSSFNLKEEDVIKIAELIKKS